MNNTETSPEWEFSLTVPPLSVLAREATDVTLSYVKFKSHSTISIHTMHAPPRSITPTPAAAPPGP